METRSQPKHVDRKTLSDDTPASENPIAKGLSVTVSIPETIEIKIVNASTLDDYEMWILLSTIIFSVAIGFVVAYAQDSSKTHLAIIGLIAFLLFVLCLLFALHKRAALRRKSKSVRMKVTEIIEDELEESE
jgi:hypothetical protein